MKREVFKLKEDLQMRDHTHVSSTWLVACDIFSFGYLLKCAYPSLFSFSLWHLFFYASILPVLNLSWLSLYPILSCHPSLYFHITHPVRISHPISQSLTPNLSLLLSPHPVAPAALLSSPSSIFLPL